MQVGSCSQPIGGEIFLFSKSGLFATTRIEKTTDNEDDQTMPIMLAQDNVAVSLQTSACGMMTASMTWMIHWR